MSIEHPHLVDSLDVVVLDHTSDSEPSTRSVVRDPATSSADAADRAADARKTFHVSHLAQHFSDSGAGSSMAWTYTRLVSSDCAGDVVV